MLGCQTLPFYNLFNFIHYLYHPTWSNKPSISTHYTNYWIRLYNNVAIYFTLLQSDEHELNLGLVASPWSKKEGVRQNGIRHCHPLLFFWIHNCPLDSSHMCLTYNSMGVAWSISLSYRTRDSLEDLLRIADLLMSITNLACQIFALLIK